LRARDKDEVIALSGELESELFSNAIGGAGYDCPAAFGTEFRELCSRQSLMEIVLVEKAHWSAWEDQETCKKPNVAENLGGDI
jgi:hypothetical protein